MLWAFAIWVGAIVVACMIASTVTERNPFPGIWGHASDEGPRIPHGGARRPAFAGRGL